MKYILELDMADQRVSFIEEFFKTISFVKKVRVISADEIINPA